MTEENNTTEKTPETPAPKAAETPAAPEATKPAPKKFERRGGRGGGGNRRPRRGRRQEREPQEFDQTIVELARVTRVTKGGKRLRFRAAMVIGDRKGRVGYGVAKGLDVQIAVTKAVRQAKKNLITVPIVNETIAFKLEGRAGAAHILLKPAPAGSGIIAGGALRTVLEYAGIPNISSKILGTKNKINNIKATFAALHELAHFNRIRPSVKKPVATAPTPVPASEQARTEA